MAARLLGKRGKYGGVVWRFGYASVVAGKGANPETIMPLESLPIGSLQLRFVLWLIHSCC
jgi:hypothetical protein